MKVRSARTESLMTQMNGPFLDALFQGGPLVDYGQLIFCSIWRSKFLAPNPKQRNKHTVKVA